MYILAFILALPVILYFYTVFIESKFLFVMGAYLKLNYKVTVEGLENIPKDGPCILVCNHLSYIDWLVIMRATPRPVHFVIHYRFYYARFVHTILKKVGAIPISGDGERPKLISKAFEKVSEDINKGNLVLIFPEGGITRDGKINRFKKGVVKIKEACPGAPIIPMALDGLWGGLYSYSKPGLFSLSKLNLKRVPLKIKFLPEYKKEIDPKELQSVISSHLSLGTDRKYVDHRSYI